MLLLLNPPQAGQCVPCGVFSEVVKAPAAVGLARKVIQRFEDVAEADIWGEADAISSLCTNGGCPKLWSMVSYLTTISIISLTWNIAMRCTVEERSWLLASVLRMRSSPLPGANLNEWQKSPPPGIQILQSMLAGTNIKATQEAGNSVQPRALSLDPEPKDFSPVIMVLDDIAAGLDYVNKKKFVHRDLKPGKGKILNSWTCS